MGLLDRFRHPERLCTDPLFGELKYRKDCWQGSVTFDPLAQKVGISLITGGAEPGSAPRRVFLELAERYQRMTPEIARTLFDLYMPERGGHPNGLPSPSGPAEMLGLTQLDWESRTGARQARAWPTDAEPSNQRMNRTSASHLVIARSAEVAGGVLFV
jgi:hypothetical protein